MIMKPFQLSYSAIITWAQIILMMAVALNWMKNNVEGAVFETNIFYHASVKTLSSDMNLTQTDSPEVLRKSYRYSDLFIKHKSGDIKHAGLKSVGGWIFPLKVGCACLLGLLDSLCC